MDNFWNNPKVLELMTLQANIRMLLIRHGMEQESALDASCEIFDSIIKDSMVKDEYVSLYQSLPDKGGE